MILEESSEGSFWEIVVQKLPNNLGILLIIAGFLALTWVFYEGKRKKGFLRPAVEDWEETNVSKFLKLLSFTGIVLGIFIIWGGINSLMTDVPPSAEFGETTGMHMDLTTSIACIIVGIVCMLKPINDIPWAGLFGIFACAGIVIITYLAMPEEWATDPTIKWIIIGVSLIFATGLGIVVSYWISSLQTISKVLSYPPIALILSIFCFIQGFMIISLGFGLANL